jgi:hypothetical protein
MTAPIFLIAATAYIIVEMGAVGLIGPAMIFITGVVVKNIQNKQGSIRGQAFVYIDERSKRVNEFL